MAETRFDPTGNTIAEAFVAYSVAHRDGCPIVHSDEHGGFWTVTGYETARAVLTDHERFRSGDGVLFPDPGAPKNAPLELDPPEHRAVRAIFNAALTPRRCDRRSTGSRTGSRH